MPDTQTPQPAPGIPDVADPTLLFQQWMEQATAGEINDPNAMALATADAHGRPSVRTVLLKGVDPRGFVFYTNFESRKGVELLANPHAALLFHWKSLRRQVRIEGAIERVSDAEADAYFASRARVSRLGAMASAQSRPMAARAELERRVADVDARYPGDTVPRPSHWSGFRVLPEVMEFWQDMPFRLHDRRLYRRDGSDWSRSILYP